MVSRGKIGAGRGSAYGEDFEAFELGALHDGVEHGLHDEARIVQQLVFVDVQPDESLEETDNDNDEQREEDERLAHHDLEHDHHGAEETERIEIEEQSHPEHGRGECQEVIAHGIKVGALFFVAAVAHGDHAQHKRYSEEGVEGAVEHVPERKIVAADFPELVDLVAHKAQSEDVEQTLDNVEIAVGIDGVDSTSVQAQKDERQGNLHPVLVTRHTHAVWVEMGPVAGVCLFVEGNKPRRVLVILHNPAAPQVRDALLVARGPDDGDGVYVDGLFDGIGRRRGFAVNEDRVALEQDLFKQVVEVLLGFDEVLGHHLGGRGAHIVQVGIP